MKRLSKWLRMVLAAATVVLLAALAWQCVDIYLDGNSPANMGADGVHISPVFSREIVAARLRPFVLPGAIYAVLAVFAGIVSEKTERSRPGKRIRMLKHAKAAAAFPKRLNVVRGVMLVLAAALIVVGILNGGVRDVLIKAINICTECIGLG